MQKMVAAGPRVVRGRRSYLKGNKEPFGGITRVGPEDGREILRRWHKGAERRVKK